MQRDATWCNVGQYCSVLQCVGVSCSVLQYLAVYCNSVLQFVAMCSTCTNAVQCVAVRCSVLVLWQTQTICWGPEIRVDTSVAKGGTY